VSLLIVSGKSSAVWEAEGDTDSAVAIGGRFA